MVLTRSMKPNLSSLRYEYVPTYRSLYKVNSLAQTAVDYVTI